MKEFGLQLHSIRDHFTTPEETRESFRRMREYGYSHAQTAGTYSYISAEAFKALADEYGIELMGTHCKWELFCNEAERMLRYHKALGVSYAGIGHMPRALRQSKESILVFIDRFNQIARSYVEEGFRALTYHHHSFEFMRIDEKTMMDYLIEGLDPRYTAFVVDTFWAQVGGEDVRAFIERLKGRIACVHLKDLDPCYYYKLADGTAM